MNNLQLQNDLEKLLAIMPDKVTSNVSIESLEDVIEIVLDIGRLPEVRKSDGSIFSLGKEEREKGQDMTWYIWTALLQALL